MAVYTLACLHTAFTRDYRLEQVLILVGCPTGVFGVDILIKAAVVESVEFVANGTLFYLRQVCKKAIPRS